MSDSKNEKTEADGDFNARQNEYGKCQVRVRTKISDNDFAILMSYYEKFPLPNRQELETISAMTGHSTKTIKIWFQNKRAKDRREGKL